MIIKGKFFVLSPRKAKDVLDLAEACKGQEENYIAGTIAMAQIINDSLKATAKSLKWYQRFRYRKFIKGATEYLLKNLSTLEVYDYYNEVLEIEGGKKKVAAESRSAEMFQKDSSLSTSE